MANYLPVLLVSVTNASVVPDDSSVSTLPRGQVDYLSHDWQEEDVWHSWRKMTRLKNEIANGLRLENASWRTWWKQRNKLKTVTPETLNWLKDSDVTWLYGPLHTAVDWTPPARTRPPDTEDGTDQPRHKPILKYRSICELLTSDLHTSPVFSPTASGDEGQQPITSSQGVSEVSPPDGQSTLSKYPRPKRPALVHTKSDTHITRWGPNRAFRKDSPPRIDPPGPSGGIATIQRKSNVDGRLCQSQIRSCHSQDSNSSTGTSTTGLTDRQSSRNPRRERHITFNTFVEQYIAIEKPNNDDDTPRLWGTRRCDDDDGYEEDKEDDEDDGHVWAIRARRHLSGSAIAGSDSDSGDDEKLSEEDDDDDAIEIRPRSYSLQNMPRKERTSRSPSTSTSVSTPSSRSTSASSPPSSISPSSNRRRQPSTSPVQTTADTPKGPLRRSSTSSAYRPRPNLYSTSHPQPFRMRARGGGEDSLHYGRSRRPPHVHVTIAPIAPTILKTTGSGYDNWAEGFGDEAGSDDGLWSKWGGYSEGEEWKERDKERAQDNEATPVGLVYVPPPFTGRFSVGFEAGTEEEDFDLDAKEERIGERKDDSRSSSDGITAQVTGGSTLATDPDMGRSDSSVASTITPHPIPTVVIESLPQLSQESQARKHLSASSGGEDELRRRFDEQNLRGSLSRRTSSPDDRRPSSRSNLRNRSRSHSSSRTPSPIVNIPTSEAPQNIAASVPMRVHPRGSSVSPPDPQSSSSSLCPPVQRGRSSSYQDLLARGQRGRSNTRTPSSHSDRERHGSAESPIGSLSPDSSFVRVSSIIGGVYANGRADKERQKEKERREESYRERERGRERGKDWSGKRSSRSLSSDVETGSMVRESSFTAGTGDSVPATNGRSVLLPEKINVAASMEVACPVDATKPHDISSVEQDSKEAQRVIQSTPSNSPLLIMTAPLAGPVALGVDTKSQVQSNANSPMDSSQRHFSHTQSPTNSHSFRTLANSVVIPSVRSPTKGKSPLLVTPPHPLEPSTSLGVSPPGVSQSPVMSPQQPQSPESPTEKESTIVGKAVGIVSSAGAFLGLWPS
ncbi:hypothetical protein APHAL10511_005248 [Amanita phalloides]|nr:hypothetical protein APHAL10511_005248 [Amanita phalloides]